MEALSSRERGLSRAHAGAQSLRFREGYGLRGSNISQERLLESTISGKREIRF